MAPNRNTNGTSDEEGNELIQGAAIVRARWLAAVGGIPCGELLREPWDRLIPRVQEAVAKEPSAFRNAQAVAQLLEDLRAHPQMTFEHLVLAGAVPENHAIHQTLHRLWRAQGVHLPRLVSELEADPEALAAVNRPIQRGVQRLLANEEAASLTPTRLHAMASAELSPEARSAIVAAQQTGALLTTPNYRCCLSVSMTNKCVDTFLSLYCAPGAGGTGCSGASQSCS